MATVKGVYFKDWAHVTVHFTLHLKGDPDEKTLGRLLAAVRHKLESMCQGLDQPNIIGNADMFAHTLQSSTLEAPGDYGEWVSVPKYVSKVEIAFEKERTELEQDPKPDEGQFVAVALPAASSKSAAEGIRDNIEQRVIGVIEVANTTRELLERYAPQMAEDPELREALTRILENERIRQFDSGTGES